MWLDLELVDTGLGHCKKYTVISVTSSPSTEMGSGKTSEWKGGKSFLNKQVVYILIFFFHPKKLKLKSHRKWRNEIKNIEQIKYASNKNKQIFVYQYNSDGKKLRFFLLYFGHE